MLWLKRSKCQFIRMSTALPVPFPEALAAELRCKQTQPVDYFSDGSIHRLVNETPENALTKLTTSS